MPTLVQIFAGGKRRRVDCNSAEGGRILLLHQGAAVLEEDCDVGYYCPNTGIATSSSSSINMVSPPHLLALAAQRLPPPQGRQEIDSETNREAKRSYHQFGYEVTNTVVTAPVNRDWCGTDAAHYQYHGHHHVTPENGHFSQRSPSSSCRTPSISTRTVRTDMQRHQEEKQKHGSFAFKFNKRCRDLMAFKEKFGHCNVPLQYVDNLSLGKWVSNMRYSYKRNQEGNKPQHNLSLDRIERLEEIGFKW